MLPYTSLTANGQSMRRAPAIRFLTANGGGWSKSKLNDIFQKAEWVSDSGDTEIRKDKCGTKIRRGSYGSRSKLGWEVDHITPVSAGGDDELQNLQPLQWENNRSKGDKTGPDYSEWLHKNRYLNTPL